MHNRFGMPLHYRIDVPTFDGHLLQWHKFWEQFQLAVHDKTSLSNAEKLVYLRHSLKGGSATQTIEGLSSSGDHYDEAIKCLKECYNKPRLIHQTELVVNFAGYTTMFSNIYVHSSLLVMILLVLS